MPTAGARGDYTHLAPICILFRRDGWVWRVSCLDHGGKRAHGAQVSGGVAFQQRKVMRLVVIHTPPNGGLAGKYFL
jgi:hypothetical protein